jgi:hypothetical protein
MYTYIIAAMSDILSDLNIVFVNKYIRGGVMMLNNVDNIRLVDGTIAVIILKVATSVWKKG